MLVYAGGLLSSSGGKTPPGKGFMAASLPEASVCSQVTETPKRLLSVPVYLFHSSKQSAFRAHDAEFSL